MANSSLIATYANNKTLNGNIMPNTVSLPSTPKIMQDIGSPPNNAPSNAKSENDTKSPSQDVILNIKRILNTDKIQRILKLHLAAELVILTRGKDPTAPLKFKYNLDLLIKLYEQENTKNNFTKYRICQEFISGINELFRNNMVEANVSYAQSRDGKLFFAVIQIDSQHFAQLHKWIETSVKCKYLKVPTLTTPAEIDGDWEAPKDDDKGWGDADDESFLTIRRCPK